MRHLPNIICILRIGLVWPVVTSMLARNYQATLWLFAVAAFSDGLDGWLAKHFHWQSNLGKTLDPLADKLLLVAVFLVATWLGLIPRWLTVAAVSRDVMIGLGALAFTIGWGPLNGAPTVWSKLNTLLQVVFVLAIVLSEAQGWNWSGALHVLAIATLCTVLISGAGYAREFTARALLVADRR